MTATDSELVVEAAPEAAPDHVGILSPSGASDFMSCPLLYRFRRLDKLPEPAGVPAVRGTLVHTVLERVFDLPAPRRVPVEAEALLEPALDEMLASEPEVATLFAPADGETPVDRTEFLAECRALLASWFSLEDPRRLEPAERELPVEHVLESGLLLRGVLDRLDVAPTGEVRVVDYKSSKAPSDLFVAKALFQLRFYALVLWRTRGVVPTLLQLVYLGNSETISYVPDEADLRATERKLQAVWAAIARATVTGDWRPHRSALCGWCAHQAICPAYGGIPPPLPEPTMATSPASAR
ncbi:MAG: PD-(D/E)XK nuclease family protein [Actinomycetota bacterium]|nr:PD-(D/E)XK nuclease family protein [Actinomycetota bacterium]MDQ3664029.1 PD-(D/E)XK nuclease family protein [Actinomycetota bacterium]